MTDWSELAARHGPAVWRTAYRLTGCEADAADCFQETFLSAFRLHGADGVRDWGAMLRHLAVARGLDALRRRKRERKGRQEWGDREEAGHPAPGPLQEAERSELAGRLRTALAQLPPRQAEVFCLRCMEECTYEEIASRLGLRVNAVGVLLHHARDRLRELLAPFVARSR
jgi:RNA polymerase sigma-70 factor (ECF subfamily)